MKCHIHVKKSTCKWNLASKRHNISSSEAPYSHLFSEVMRVYHEDNGHLLRPVPLWCTVWYTPFSISTVFLREEGGGCLAFYGGFNTQIQDRAFVQSLVEGKEKKQRAKDWAGVSDSLLSGSKAIVTVAESSTCVHQSSSPLGPLLGLTATFPAEYCESAAGTRHIGDELCISRITATHLSPGCSRVH